MFAEAAGAGEVGGEASHLALEEGHGAEDEDHEAVGAGAGVGRVEPAGEFGTLGADVDGGGAEKGFVGVCRERVQGEVVDGGCIFAGPRERAGKGEPHFIVGKELG